MCLDSCPHEPTTELWCVKIRTLAGEQQLCEPNATLQTATTDLDSFSELVLKACAERRVPRQFDK
jgi:hypothetical protein